MSSWLTLAHRRVPQKANQKLPDFSGGAADRCSPFLQCCVFAYKSSALRCPALPTNPGIPITQSIVRRFLSDYAALEYRQPRFVPHAKSLKMLEHWEKVPYLITKLYGITDELEAMFGRKFTPDGHLVGSIGEAIAVYTYDLTLTDPSFKTHDARTKDNKRLVQIKFTAGDSGFGIYGKPDYLIALRLINRRDVLEVFNGPGEIAWQCAGKPQKNGQCSMAMGRLAALNYGVPVAERVPRVRELQMLQRIPF
jgi:hypothetical protein